MIELRRLLALYPRSWRDRYEPEMVEVLADRVATWSDAIDLVRGAADAHLHPPSPSRVPGLAAVTAGAAWLVVAVGVLVEPVAPDWPGLLAWTLPPAAVAATASALALGGIILAAGAGSGLAGRAAVVAGLLGSTGLAIALIVATVGGPYGAITGAALSVAGVGTAVSGVVATSRGASVPGTLLVIAGVAWLLPAPTGWLVAGVAWSAIGLFLVSDRVRPAPDTGRPG